MAVVVLWIFRCWVSSEIVGVWAIAHTGIYFENDEWTLEDELQNFTNNDSWYNTISYFILKYITFMEKYDINET